MPRTAPAADADRTDLHQDITDRIIAELEAGRVPWVQPWSAARAPLDMPHNAATRALFRHQHRHPLGCSRGWRLLDPRLLTFHQALGLSGHVRKGERGTTVVYAKPFTPAEEKRRAAAEGREAGRVPMLKHFTVFNTDQCDDLPADTCAPPAPVPENLVLLAAEALIAATRTDSRIGGDQAFYAPASTMCILIELFAIQSRGTARVGALFGSVMAIYFAVLAVLGLISIADRPEVLAALNPIWAARFFSSTSSSLFWRSDRWCWR